MKNTTTIQFIKDSLQRQADYWDGQRDSSDDNAYNEVVSLLDDLRDTTDVIDKAILEAFSSVWDSALEPETVWADLLKRVGFRFFPDEAEGVLREFLDMASDGDA